MWIYYWIKNILFLLLMKSDCNFLMLLNFRNSCFNFIFSGRSSIFRCRFQWNCYNCWNWRITRWRDVWHLLYTIYPFCIYTFEFKSLNFTSKIFRFFLYVLLAACAVLVVVAVQQFVVSFTVSTQFFASVLDWTKFYSSNKLKTYCLWE